MATELESRAEKTEPATLLERMQEEERQFLETGRLYGLEELPIKQGDPVGFEVTFDTLSSSTMAAFETANAISFSPFLREGWDGIFGLLTPTGDTICTSVGVMTHTLLAGEGVKWALREHVEIDPGIEPGDIFEQSSQHISAMHANDAYTYIPVFAEGELVAWTFSMVHRWDAGQYIYGAMSIAADNRFAEGMQLYFEKIGRNDVLSAEYERRIRHANRLPHLWMSDASACVAGGFEIRNAVQRVVAKHGVEYFKQISLEFIEDARRKTLGRIQAQMVPGRYRKRVQRALFLADKETLLKRQRKDWLMLVPTEIRLDGAGDLHWSYHGASEYLPFGLNLGPHGLTAAASLALCGALSFERNNTGSLSVNRISPGPPGSWTNPTDPFAYIMNWTVQLDMQAHAGELLARSYFARGYWEEAMSGGSSVVHNEFEGTSVHDTPFFGQLMDAVGSGLPGQPLRDGPDCAGNPALPITDIGNIEVWENYAPLLWLGRRLDTDGCGKGKFRGGVNMVPAYLWLYRSGTYQRQDNGAHAHIPGNDGMFGAYPGPTATGLLIDASEIRRRIEKRLPLPHGRGGPITPEHVRAGIGEEHATYESYPIIVPKEIEEYTFFDSSSPGAPGVGDPLERDPEHVRLDLEAEIATPWAAREIWGVAAEYDEATRTWSVDDAGTERLREGIRARRAHRAVPFREWWTAERERVLSGDLHPAAAEMLRTSAALSDEYAREVLDFWQLPTGHAF